MTTNEFESYSRAIALSIVKFKRGIIDGNELIQAMEVILGEKIFAETERIMDKKVSKK